MSALRFVTCWANAPFAIAIGVVLVFLLLQATGVMGLLGGDGDGGDADADADHDFDQDVDHDVGADADADHDAEAAHESEGRGIGEIGVGLLGVGRIPLSVIWQTYALFFALTGFGLNWHHLSSATVPSAVSLLWTLPVAFVVGYTSVAVVARFLGPVLSSKDQEATSRTQLVGQIGVVISSRVDHEFGEVRIRDKSGHDVRVVCKLPARIKEAVPEHREVVVVEYEPERGELLVEPLDTQETNGERRAS